MIALQYLLSTTVLPVLLFGKTRVEIGSGAKTRPNKASLLSVSGLYASNLRDGQAQTDHDTPRLLS
jgi:hypothetical protein